MQESLRQLVELHRLDEKLHQIGEGLRVLPEERAAIDEVEAAAREALDRARGSLQQLQHEQRQAEGSLQDLEVQRTRLEGQQSQVKSNEAYTALLHEIDAAIGGISRIETQILESMEAAERAARALEEAEAEAVRIESEARARRLTLEARSEQLSKERAELEAARERLAAKLDREPLARYERIAERRRPAIVLVSGEVCLGCRVGIPPQLYVEVLSGELMTCGSCQRILVHERVLEQESEGTGPAT